MNSQTKALKLDETIDIGFIDVNKAEFYQTEGGFTALKYNNNDYKRITLKRALPNIKPMEYVSIYDDQNNEIGIINKVSALNEPQRKIVIDELDKRYYCPVISKIQSVKDKLGYVYFELIIQNQDRFYEKNCAVKDVSKNIRYLSEDTLIIIDVDGNRFLINSLSKLDKKSLRKLEPYLY